MPESGAIHIKANVIAGEIAVYEQERCTPLHLCFALLGILLALPRPPSVIFLSMPPSLYHKRQGGEIRGGKTACGLYPFFHL